MKISRIKETCLYVADLQQTLAFYNGQLGLPLLSLVEGRHVFFRAGESVLLCFIAAQTEQEAALPPHGARGRIHFAFEVIPEAYENVLKTVEEAGIGILHHQEWKNGKRSFYFSDPDNHLVEVIEEGLWEGG